MRSEGPFAAPYALRTGLVNNLHAFEGKEMFNSSRIRRSRADAQGDVDTSSPFVK